jgi:F0F1-type ATP synthase membrane subunit a
MSMQSNRSKVPRNLRGFAIIVSVMGVLLALGLYYGGNEASAKILWMAFGTAVGALGAYIFLLRSR